MLSTMMTGRRKLFLTKTHTALQNLQRRIENPGADAGFVSIDSFTKRVNLPDYDIIFVDECSTIDNRVMRKFLEKMRPDYIFGSCWRSFNQSSPLNLEIGFLTLKILLNLRAQILSY